MEESGKRVKRVVDEGLRAIDKRTGKYVNVIKRTIDDSLFPIVKYLSYSYNELNYDYVKNLNIVSGDNMDGFNKLEGMARKADLINVMSLYDKK
jgi:hypothetical protein